MVTKWWRKLTKIHREKQSSRHLLQKKYLEWLLFYYHCLPVDRWFFEQMPKITQVQTVRVGMAREFVFFVDLHCCECRERTLKFISATTIWFLKWLRKTPKLFHRELNWTEKWGMDKSSAFIQRVVDYGINLLSASIQLKLNGWKNDDGRFFLHENIKGSNVGRKLCNICVAKGRESKIRANSIAEKWSRWIRNISERKQWLRRC